MAEAVWPGGVEDVAATVETLRDTYRGWHEPIAANQREHELRELFPDVA